MNVIELEQIKKSYRAGPNEVPVLRGIDLVVEPGEYVALMGRSGAGKSTLMNIVGCLDLPSSGVYKLAGREVSAMDDDALSEIRGRTIGFVFQSFHLLKDRTVRENVELPMEYQRVEAEERAARAAALLERVGLGEKGARKPRELSGGERQRVAIARALANDPALLLADEPTGNLDSAARDRILALFEELRERDGLTLVMVTHDDLIGERARRRVTLADGRVVEDRRRPS